MPRDNRTIYVGETLQRNFVRMVGNHGEIVLAPAPPTHTHKNKSWIRRRSNGRPDWWLCVTNNKIITDDLIDIIILGIPNKKNVRYISTLHDPAQPTRFCFFFFVFLMQEYRLTIIIYLFRIRWLCTEWTNCWRIRWSSCTRSPV